jgi:uncharacterized DUF497 family protein
MIRQQLRECTGFQWDDGNSEKNWVRHGVTRSECEQLFFNHPLIVAPDVKHSQEEARYYALGHTDAHRLLFVVFTFRDELTTSLIRVISARDMTKKERRNYEKERERDTSFRQ